jgi:hypothetical protein
MTIPTDAQLKIKVGFLSGAAGSDGVNFQIHFEQDGNRQTLMTQFAAYDGKLDEKTINLANFAARTGQFILEVEAGKSAGQDWAVWVEAVIITESVQAQPDLVVDDIRLQPNNFLEISVKNIGTGPLVSGWNAIGQVSIDGQIAGTFDLRNAQSETAGGIEIAGGSSSYQLPWEITVPSLISCFVDSQNSINESNENNNLKEEDLSPSTSNCASGCECLTLDDAKTKGFSQYCQGVEVICGYADDDTPMFCWTEYQPEPDLLIRSVRLNILGDNLYEIEYLIINWGVGPAPSSISRLFIDDGLVSEAIVSEMASGEERYETFSWNYDFDACTAPSDNIRIVADQPGLIAESYEDNNEYSLLIACESPSPETLPDLQIRRVWTEDLGGGENRIGVEVENFSTGSAATSQLGFFIDDVLVEEITVPDLDPLEFVELVLSTHYTVGNCTGDSDTLRFEVDHIGSVVESNETNNEEFLEWTCGVAPLADLIINNVWWEYNPATYDYILNYSIQNQSLTPAGTSATKIWVNDVLIGISSVPALDGSEIIGMVTFPDHWEPITGENHIKICADSNNSIEESPAGEVNNCLSLNWPLPDLKVLRIWLEDLNVLCYEVKNEGGVVSPGTTSEVYIRGNGTCPTDTGQFMYPSLPEIAAGENEIICINLEISASTYANGCNRSTLFVRVEADHEFYYSLPTNDDFLIENLNNLCADGIQNQGEEGIDCGGPCPTVCQDCWARVSIGSAEDAGYFSLYSPRVFATARLALFEYANCLRDPACRSTLAVYDPNLDYSTVTANLLAGNTDYIMEAVAYYVDKYTQYMFDDDCDICDGDGVMTAEDMILYSGSRYGVLTDDVPCIDPFLGMPLTCKLWGNCEKLYCGDCEDHAVLRGALMRVLGISHTCAYAADHYNGYWGEGHTYNLVFYRSKWRIMDYGRLGSAFFHYNHSSAHSSNNVWNDHVGEYWCPDWISDPACWICCNTDPYSLTQNYADGPVCNPNSTRNYYIDCAP